MTINIKSELVGTVERLAQERQITTGEYVQRYIDSHLSAQFKDFIIKKILNDKIEDLVVIETVMNDKRQELKQAFELANPVIKPENKETI